MKTATLSSSLKNPDLIVDNEEYTVENEEKYSLVFVKDNGTLTLGENSSLTAETVRLETGSTLNITVGTFTVKNLIVESGLNTINGNSIEKYSANAAIHVEAGATLKLSKILYDDLLTWRTFVSNGFLNVEEVSGLMLTQADIESLIQINTIRNVIFNQDLYEINKLSFLADSVFDIAFNSGFGTLKDDSITINKNAVITLGKSGENKRLNLRDGKNTVSIKGNAVATFRCELLYVANITIDSGYGIKVGNVTTQKYTTAYFDYILFSDHNASLKIGAFADVSTGSLESRDNRNNNISVDKNSFLSVDGNLLNFNTITIASGTKFKDISTEESLQHYTYFTSGDIKAIVKTANFTFKNYVKANVGDIETGTNKDTLSIGDYSTFESGLITMGGNNDTIKIGSCSTFTAGAVEMGDGKNNFSEKGKSDVKLTSLKNVNRLDIANGSKDDFTELKITGDFTGTNDSSKFTFGNYAEVEIGSFKAGVSNDTFSIGKFSTFISGAIDMGGGNDNVTIGDSTVFTASTVKLGDGKNSFTEKSKANVHLASLEGVNKFTLSNGSKDNFTVLDISGNYTASDYNDKLTIGKYADVNIHGGINFYAGQDELSIGNNSVVRLAFLEGVNKFTLSNGSKDNFTVLDISGNYTASNYNDKLTIGNYADVNIHGGINFGDGKDELSVGNNSVVVLKASLTSVSDHLNKFTLGKETVAYLSAAMCVKITTSESTLKKNKTFVYNIGDYETSLAFTAIGDAPGQENADDGWEQQAALGTGTYTGWLCGKDSYEGAKLDTSDFFDVKNIDRITFNASNSVVFRYYTYIQESGEYKEDSVIGNGSDQVIDVSAASVIEMTCVQDAAAVKYSLIV